MKNTNRRHRFPFAAFALALFMGAAGGLPAQADSALVLRQLDVGQGDAAIIRTPEGKTIVIDAGPDARETSGAHQKAQQSLT